MVVAIMVKEVDALGLAAMAQKEDAAHAEGGQEGLKEVPKEVDLQEGKIRSGEVSVRKMQCQSRSKPVGTMDKAGRRNTTHPLSRC